MYSPLGDRRVVNVYVLRTKYLTFLFFLLILIAYGK